MNLATFLANAIEKLKLSGIDNPQLDARLLACHALGIDRAQLLSQSDRRLNDTEQAVLDALMARRTKRESVARIIGKREFWGLEFGLNEATLEPRPDSETLIEVVLSSFRRKPESSLSLSLLDTSLLDSGLRRNDEPRILDLGTGTGCLLLSLLHEMSQATGIGIDINPRAVEQAVQNAAALGLASRANFQKGDWLDGVTGTFDIIISNPPYIPNFYIEALMPEVRDYDPMLALDGGADGLTPYHHLIPQLKNFLNPNGIVCFEVGVTQAPQVVDLFTQSGFQNITTHKDLGGIERCVLALFT